MSFGAIVNLDFFGEDIILAKIQRPLLIWNLFSNFIKSKLRLSTQIIDKKHH